MGGSSRLALSNALPSPIGVRARLNSLGSNSIRHKKGTSSSTITVQAPKHQHPPPRPITPSSSEEDSTDSEDEEALKEEEADRKVEEQEALDRKLQELQRMMTNDALGLVTSRERKGSERGRRWPPISSSVPSLAAGGYRHRDDTLSIRSNSTSQSVSSASSPQGSIPDIPSPSTYGGGSQPHSPMGRHMSPSKSSSPPSVSSGVATGRRYAPLSLSDQGSNQGSETSSFSDISGE